MCSCNGLNDLHTATCVSCGKTPTSYTGHVGKLGQSVTAGWCSTLCQSQFTTFWKGYGYVVVGGHFGEWESHMGLSHGPVWAHVKMPVKVKCIDADELGFLKEGQVYEVEGRIGSGYNLVGVPCPPNGTAWMGSRFVAVEESKAFQTDVVAKATTAGSSDAAKAMKFFQTSAHPDCCPKCAAPKPCNYHP